MGSQPVALYARPSSGSITTQYFHLDHLGSVAEVTNSSGVIDVSMNFDAFGQRRDATDWSGPPAAGVLNTIAGISQRGFTFHTNLEASSLIHMNGRVADGLTGRFLSADPYVSNPGGTQFFNRYSYVNNNPLSFTDPSGFCDTFLCATIVSSVFNTIANFLFGGSSAPPPPTKGCWVAATACYGKAGSSKLFDMVNDIMKMPGSRMVSQHQDIVLHVTDPATIVVGDASSRVCFKFYLQTEGLEKFGEALKQYAFDELFEQLLPDAARVCKSDGKCNRP